jgi:hypothetical protein
VVCQRWRLFDNFLADMGERPNGTSLDRFPHHDGNYEPGNCRWATRVEQARNTRKAVVLTVSGEKKTLSEWAELRGISAQVIYKRIFESGWSVERAVLTPSRPYARRSA